VVVAVGLTLVELLAVVDVNVPGVMTILVAPVVVQLSVLLVPELMVVSAAVKDVIAGAEPGPEPEFDIVNELQPASPTKANRISANARRSNPEAWNPRELSPVLRNEPAESMHSPLWWPMTSS
jgi:hypothetical protein